MQDLSYIDLKLRFELLIYPAQISNLYSTLVFCAELPKSTIR